MFAALLKSVCAMTVLVVACGYAGTAMAQQSPTSYPSKPVKIVIPLGPGNSIEIATRLVAEKLSAALGQPFVIEAQPGAAGQIGTERVARSPADGYTLLSANDGIITMLPNLKKHIPFDPVRDFSPIAQMIGIPIVLIAHPSVQAKTAQELVQLAKARPGKLEYSSGGTGSAQQLAMELFMSLTGTHFLHVPYKGAPQAAMDVVSGQIPVAMAGVPIVVSLIKQGRLRALGIASDKRLPLLADTPTLAEQGIPLRFATWGGLFAPAGTPVEIIRRLNRETLVALNSADVQAKMAEFGFEIYGNSPEQFSDVVKTDLARMAGLIKRAGIELQ
jgi:tripartite-type tricarboxylate transporter receptor subunit TctC